MPRVQTEGLLDQLLLWVLNVLSLLNSTDGEQTPEQQSPNAPAPPPPITDFLPAELKQVRAYNKGMCQSTLFDCTTLVTWCMRS